MTADLLDRDAVRGPFPGALPSQEVLRARAAERSRALLEAGVPLTLLLDLASPQGPASQEAYASEGGRLRGLRTC